MRRFSSRRPDVGEMLRTWEGRQLEYTTPPLHLYSVALSIIFMIRSSLVIMLGFTATLACVTSVLAIYQPPVASRQYGHLNSNLYDASSQRTLGLNANLTSTLHLSSVSSVEQFTTLSHPLYPNHRVRVKKSNFCDPTVKYVGGTAATANLWTPRSNRTA